MVVGGDRPSLFSPRCSRPSSKGDGWMQAAWSALVALWGLEGKLASIDTSIVMSGDIGDIRSFYQWCLQINTVAECIISFFFVGLVRAVRVWRGVHRIHTQPLHTTR